MPIDLATYRSMIGRWQARMQHCPTTIPTTARPRQLGVPTFLEVCTRVMSLMLVSLHGCGSSLYCAACWSTWHVSNVIFDGQWLFHCSVCNVSRVKCRGAPLLLKFSMVVMVLLLLRGGDVESNPGPETQLKVDNLGRLKRLLQPVSAYWVPIADQLGMTSQVAIIQGTLTNTGPSAFLRDLLYRWLSTGHPSPTLEFLCQALRGDSEIIGGDNVAGKLEEEFQDQKVPQLEMTVRESHHGSYAAAKLQSLVGPQMGLLQQQLSQLQDPSAEQLQMSPHLVSQVQSTQAASQLTPQPAQVELPPRTLQVEMSSHLSQVESLISLPHYLNVSPPQCHVQLPVALRSAIKESNGCTQGDIAYILANCDTCKDFKMCKTRLIKGVKRGLVICHLRHDGFKLANFKRHHHLNHRPTCHQRIYTQYYYTRTHHMISRLKCHLTLCHLKRLLPNYRHRHFELRLTHPQCSHLKHSLTHDQDIRQHTGKCSTDGSWSNFGMLMNTSSSISVEDISTSPIPFPTPGGDDMTPPDLHQIPFTTETPCIAHDVLTPFPTPSEEDDLVTPRMYGPQQEAELSEEQLKVLFITEVGRCDFNTIASVGRCLLGDNKYESILKCEQQKQVKRIVNQVFVEWKKREVGINFCKLLKTFRLVGSKELVNNAQVFRLKQARLFADEIMER